MSFGANVVVEVNGLKSIGAIRILILLRCSVPGARTVIDDGVTVIFWMVIPEAGAFSVITSTGTETRTNRDALIVIRLGLIPTTVKFEGVFIISFVSAISCLPS